MLNHLNPATFLSPTTKWQLKCLYRYLSSFYAPSPLLSIDLFIHSPVSFMNLFHFTPFRVWISRYCVWLPIHISTATQFSCILLLFFVCSNSSAFCVICLFVQGLNHRMSTLYPLFSFLQTDDTQLQ